MAENIHQVLKSFLPVDKIIELNQLLLVRENLVLVADPGNKEEEGILRFLISKSSLSILVPTDTENNAIAVLKELAKISPSQVRFVLNFDQGEAKEIEEKEITQILTYGFQEGADFQASDLKMEEGTNFKINYKGNSVPVWLTETFSQEQIYRVLIAVVVGTIFDLNLVEISQVLKENRVDKIL